MGICFYIYEKEPETVLHHVKLNRGQIACPYCHVTLIMDSVLDPVFVERQCPSCKNVNTLG